MKYLAASVFVALTLACGVAAHAERLEPFNSVYARTDYSSTYLTVKTLADEGSTSAQFELGRMFENGIGVGRDPQQAVFWYGQAAAQGDAEAQTNLGVLYARGVGVPRNDGYAVAWFRKAAEQGLAKAQYDLGYMYAKGLGVPRDDQLAIDWYRKAAGQGVVRAQYNLGEIYSKGVGVPKDDQQAYFWWLLASAQGFAQAVEKRDLVELKLPPEQRAGAQVLARSWIPKLVSPAPVQP
ncbi:MAG: tetratricopeptide repeat protein [Polaromonas sp.]